MQAFLLLLVNHIGTITSVMKLVEQGVKIAPEIIELAGNQWKAITDFWRTGELPTKEEMAALTEERRAIEDYLLSVKSTDTTA